jgi:ABC-type transporter Mla maintaining outer membrane lipid asymmetry ATPase subunit MlaF
VTSITVTHDMASAFKIADRIVMLHEGKIIFDGTSEEIQRTEVPMVRQFVRGEATDSELAALDDAEQTRDDRDVPKGVGGKGLIG